MLLSRIVNFFRNLFFGGASAPVLPLYEVIDCGEGKLSIVKILNGKYKGTEYYYGKVRLLEENGKPVLSFVTEFIVTPDSFKDDDKFTVVSGAILHDLMLRNADDVGKFLVG